MSGYKSVRILFDAKVGGSLPPRLVKLIQLATKKDMPFRVEFFPENEQYEFMKWIDNGEDYVDSRVKKEALQARRDTYHSFLVQDIWELLWDVQRGWASSAEDSDFISEEYEEGDLEKYADVW